MSTSSPSPKWPTWLLLIIAVGPPSAAVVPFLPTITHHPFLAAGVLFVYWLLLGCASFLQKIWERRVDAWADASASHLERLIRVLFGGAGRRYREFFCYEYGDLDMKGISTRGTYTLDLEQVFVELRIDPTPAHKVSSDPIRLPSELSSGRHDIWDYLRHLDEHLVILGAPGSGKTTLLKHLGLHLIRDHRRRGTRGTKLPWSIPIFLPLREQNTQLKEQPDYSLIEAARLQISKWKLPIPAEWIEHQLQQGRCLVLLDGMDEVAEKAQRQQMVDWVERQMSAYPKNRFVISSRPLGYQTNPLNRVATLDVQPFTLEQITRFLHVWYLCNERKRAKRDDPGVQMRAEAGAKDLLERLRTTDALSKMAVNPLLLTMIATVHLYYGQLPGARVTLYKAICEVFLSRRAEVPGVSKELRAEQRQLVLQSLAYTLMQDGRGEISCEDACTVLAAPLQLVDTTLTPGTFLDHLEPISSGLLLEQEQRVYSFAHKTFQEYLAMAYMQEHHLEHELAAHVEESYWHETILLFCAQADATAILEACMKRNPPSLEALTLAIDCVEEARSVKPDAKEQLYALLEQGVDDADPERQRVIIEALLKRRLRQMQKMQEGIFVDTSMITYTEYQLFVDEQPLPNRSSLMPVSQGHGHDVLLGVCIQNAKAFCRWLTERDQEGHTYRLPREEEREHIRRFVGARLPQDTGYWEENGTLNWAQNSPPPWLLDQVLRTLPLNLTRTLASPTYALFTRTRDLDLALDRVRTFARARARIHDRDLALDGDLALALAHVLALAFDLTYDRAHRFTRTRDHDLNHAYDRAHRLTRTRDLDLDCALGLFLEVYSMLFLLQRPKRMLPVYEGILLIKERPSQTASTA